MKNKTQKKKESKKAQGFFPSRVDTKVGTLIIILFALPVVILANLYRQNLQQQNTSMVQGVSYSTGNSFMPNSGSGMTHPNCPPGADSCSKPLIPQQPTGCYYTSRCLGIKGSQNCQNILVCPSNVPTMQTCLPRPACLDGTPPCLPPVPQGGWCPPSPSQTQLLAPSPMLCGGFVNNPPTCPTGYTCDYTHSHPDFPGNCVSLTPSPLPTCLPRPSCLDANPACQLPQPSQGWCPPLQQSGSGSSISSIWVFLKNFLKNLQLTQ